MLARGDCAADEESMVVCHAGREIDGEGIDKGRTGDPAKWLYNANKGTDAETECEKR